MSKPDIRITLDLSRERFDRLCHMSAKLGRSTHGVTFNVALTLLEWAIGERERGRAIASFDDATRERFLLSMKKLDAIELADPSNEAPTADS